MLQRHSGKMVSPSSAWKTNHLSGISDHQIKEKEIPDTNPHSQGKALSSVKFLNDVIYLLLSLFLISTPPSLMAKGEVPVTLTRKKEGVTLFFEYPTSVSYGVNKGKQRVEVVFDTDKPFNKKTIKKGLPKGFSFEEVQKKNGVTSLFLKLPPKTLVKHERTEKGITFEFFPGQGNDDESAAEVEIPKIVIDQKEAKPQSQTDTVTITNSENGADIKFMFKKVPAVAAYERNDKIYLIFDRKITVEPQGKLSPQVGTMKTETKGPLTLITFQLTNPGNYFIKRDDNKWHFSIDWVGKRSRTKELHPFKGSFALNSDNKLAYTLNLPEKAMSYAIMDPIRGDTLLIIPFKSDGYAIFQNNRYLDFEVIPSQQGVVIAKKHKSVKGQIRDVRFELNSPQGLFLSSDADRIRERKTLKGFALFDFAKWQESDQDFQGYQADLQRKISTAKPDVKTGLYMDLIRHNLSYGRAVEAIGLLRIVEEDDPRMKYDPNFHALRGAARLMVGDAQMALQDLTWDSLAQEPEAQLWKGIAYLKSGKALEGLSIVQDKLPFLAQYPQPVKSSLTLIAAKSAIDNHKVELAQVLIESLKNEKLPLTDRGDYQLLLGLLEKAKRNFQGAEEQLKEVAKGPDSKAAVYASLRGILLGLKTHDLTADQAIENLEKLRYSWRGDEIEFDILSELGRLYIEKGDYRKGLSAMASAVQHYPNAKGFKDLSARLHKAFADLFLSPDGQKVPTLTAISLYQGFKSLTPQGEDGDKIVLTLADRLLGLDLPDQAAGVINERLQEASQGNIPLIHKLVQAYIAQGDSEGAQLMLDGALQQDMSEDDRRGLRQLKAKIHVKNKQLDDALNLLNTDESFEGLTEKAQIYSAKGQYPEAAAAMGRALSQKKPSQTDPSAILSYALYLNKSQDWAALQDLKIKYEAQLKNPKDLAALNLLIKSQGGSTSLDKLQQELDDVDLFDSYFKKEDQSQS